MLIIGQRFWERRCLKAARPQPFPIPENAGDRDAEMKLSFVGPSFQVIGVHLFTLVGERKRIPIELSLAVDGGKSEMHINPEQQDCQRIFRSLSLAHQMSG